MKLCIRSTKHLLDHGAVSKKVLAKNTTSLGEGYNEQAVLDRTHLTVQTH